MSSRKALCVGVNQYRNYPGATLQGCVPDANEMSALLMKQLGFTPPDITILTDAKATKENIIGNLKAMVQGAIDRKYSYLVFSMSSHGTQVPDVSGDEPDRADEAFCPHDLAESGGQWDRNHIIVDDELRDIFIKLPENVLLEVYLDTCHSGTGLKGFDLSPDRRMRYLPPPSMEAFLDMESRRSRGLNRAMLEKRIVHHILWAACRSNQTAADAHLAGGWHGAFTYFFCKEMYACNNKLSRAEVLKKVRTALAAAHYSQIPQLECEATKRNTPLPEMQMAAAGA